MLAWVLWFRSGQLSTLIFVRIAHQNLLSVRASHTPREVAVELERRGLTTADFKAELAELMCSHIVPIGEEWRRLREDRAYVVGILEDGEERAREMAERTMEGVRGALRI